MKSVRRAAWLGGLLFLAVAGCETGSDTIPTARRAATDQQPATRPVQAPAAANKHLESADVIFAGILKSTAYLNVDYDSENRRLVVGGPPGLIIAAADPRFLVEVEISKVTKGDDKDWSGTRFLAIHSLVKSFMGGETAAGRPFVFYLWKGSVDAEQYVMLQAVPLP